MTALTWDAVGKRYYETGVDKGVLYIPNVSGVYDTGFAWNGLTAVTESPGGAEASPQYADNIKYLNLVSAEEFAGTIEAFTYPDEFGQCDGSVALSAGIIIGQQSRKQFGLCYRTKLGNDLTGTDYGYKLHLLYGCLAAPSEKAYATMNDSPEATAFSWEITTTPVVVTNQKPAALLTVDSSKVLAATLTTLETLLYGSAGVEPRLPLPDEINTLFSSGLTKVDLGVSTNQPTYVAGTHIITLPAVTGVQWQINGVNKTSGAQPALTTGQTAVVTAVATSGYYLAGDNDWVYNF